MEVVRWLVKRGQSELVASSCLWPRNQLCNPFSLCRTSLQSSVTNCVEYSRIDGSKIEDEVQREEMGAADEVDPVWVGVQNCSKRTREQDKGMRPGWTVTNLCDQLPRGTAGQDTET
jgi:hypothetical protein